MVETVATPARRTKSTLMHIQLTTRRCPGWLPTPCSHHRTTCIICHHNISYSINNSHRISSTAHIPSRHIVSPLTYSSVYITPIIYFRQALLNRKTICKCITRRSSRLGTRLRRRRHTTCSTGWRRRSCSCRYSCSK